MTRDLYLHETVDIVGQGQYEYMEHLWKDPVLRMPEMFGLQGSFYVCAAGGGRWPQVINIWDVGTRGWRGWASNVDRMNLKRRQAFYGDWWDEAAKWRTGGVGPPRRGVLGRWVGRGGQVAYRRVRPPLRRRPGQPDHRAAGGRGRARHAFRARAAHGDARLAARLPRCGGRRAGTAHARLRPRAHRAVR